MKTVYDILNDVHTDTDAYDAEVMSDIEMKKIKKRCLNSVRKNKVRNKRMVASIVGIMIAIITFGGTIYAYNKGLLEGIFKERTGDYDESKHYDKTLMESEYVGDIVVETNAKEELVEFEVLLAAKGKYSVECAVLATYNKDLTEDGFAVDIGLAYFDELYGKVLGGAWSYSGWIENYIDLAANQEIFYLSVNSKGYEDISNIESVTLEFLQRGEGVYIYNENEKFPFSPDGNKNCWYVTIPVTLSYEDFCYDVEDIYLEDGITKIEKIYLQPSKLEISMKVDAEEKINIESNNIALIFSNEDKINVKDFCCGSESNNYSKVEYYFNSLIKTEEVVAIEINGQLIELK